MNYKITYNGFTGSYTVWRRSWSGWVKIPHPWGKIIRTRQHAINFLNLYKRAHPRKLRPICSNVEYFN